MGMYNDVINAKKEFVIWGCGKYLEDNINRLNPDIKIRFLCDSNKEKWNHLFTSLQLPCISPDELLLQKDIVVLIAVLDKAVSKEIAQWLKQNNILFLHMAEAINAYQDCWEEKEIKKYEDAMMRVKEPAGLDKLKYFINVSVPVEVCNLQCQYCYIGQNQGMKPKEMLMHSPRFIRRALSRKRLGGTALINFCGVGETLLCQELVSIIWELLDEGHYISIITNAVLRKPLEKLLEKNEEYCERLFFKCSFHYRELKKRNLLDLFAQNVHYIDDKGASYSIELVPEDELVPMREEVKEFSIKEFGALPHVTVARDERKSDIPILTKYSDEEYRKIWSEFESSMFDVKMKYRENREEYCLAGSNSFVLDLGTGDVFACPYNESRANFYQDISQKISYEPIGYSCKSPYCINAHAYLTLGLINEINDYSYLETRDRDTMAGETWVKGKMAQFLAQRIYDNCMKEDKSAYE